jgi:C_GCAxxG_C_C family probable redox protein
LAVAEKYDVKSDVIPGIATGFCGGMSRTSGMCGALTGGVMALGILFGRNLPGDSITKIYALTAQLVRDFEKAFGSDNCSDILGCDLSTPEGDEVFKAKNLGKTVCLDITVKATDLVMQVLDRQDDIKHPLL